MVKSISVRIRGFEKFKGRGDVKHNSWFRCSNRLLEDPDFYEFSHAELLVWVYILSLASIKNSDEVEINFDRADRVCRLKRKDVLSAIEKLEGNQVDRLSDTDAVRARYADDTPTCATNTQTDITHTPRTPSASGLPPLADQWNEEVKNLPKVKNLKGKRLSALEKHEQDYDYDTWRKIFQRADSSRFLAGGGSRGWRATFDWVLKNASRVDEGEFDSGKEPETLSVGSMRGA